MSAVNSPRERNHRFHTIDRDFDTPSQNGPQSIENSVSNKN